MGNLIFIFQPFYKASDSKGFGLGLAIVKTIIYSHGGRIKLYRSELGGLKMKIKLPI
jgi:signal transduction histidine kinase